MKILYHHRTRSKDGQNVHIEELTAALKAEGHDLFVVAPGGMEEQEFGSGAGFVDLLKAKLPGALYEIAEFCYSFVAYRKLAAACRQHEPDFLYERYSLFLLAGRWLSRRHKIPYLLEINAPLAEERSRHDGLSLQAFANWCERRAWQSANVCLPVTETLAGYVRDAGVPASQVHVIQNGVNLARFPADPEDPDRLDALRQKLSLQGKSVLGFTGFMRDWHGLEKVLVLLSNWPEERRRQWHFLVVGDGPARENLQRKAAELHLVQSLTITGVVPRDAVADYVRLFDIALQPQTVAYASPLKAFEYMALARAIVAPDQPNIREVLTDAKNAVLFDSAAKGAFEEAVTRLAQSAPLRHQLGAAARQVIFEQRLTWEENAKRVVRLASHFMSSTEST